MKLVDEFSTGDLSSNNFHPSFIKIKKRKISTRSKSKHVSTTTWVMTIR